MATNMGTQSDVSEGLIASGGWNFETTLGK